ncbi:unnamed protein product, partial [Iphiclides podalirius]
MCAGERVILDSRLRVCGAGRRGRGVRAHIPPAHPPPPRSPLTTSHGLRIVRESRPASNPRPGARSSPRSRLPRPTDKLFRRSPAS